MSGSISSIGSKPNSDTESEAEPSRSNVSQVYHLSFTCFMNHLTTVELLVAKGDEIKKFLSVNFKGSKFGFQFERGNATDAIHLQGWINLKVKERPMTWRDKISDMMPLCFVRPTSTPGRLAAQNYCFKEETRIVGPWADCEFVAPYRGEDLIVDLYPWQQDLKDKINSPYVKRIINWVWEPVGGVGKSDFSKYMRYHHNIPSIPHGRPNDLLNYVYKNPGKKAYIVDLPRTRGKEHYMEDVYCVLEQLKNGTIFNGKYETGDVLMTPPHVIVFANYPPDYERCSLDRWKVFTVVDNRLVIDQARRTPDLSINTALMQNARGDAVAATWARGGNKKRKLNAT